MEKVRPFYMAHSKTIPAHSVRGLAQAQITKSSMNHWRGGAVFGILFFQLGVSRKETGMTHDPDWHYWIGGILALPVAALFIALIGACLDGWLLGL